MTEPAGQQVDLGTLVFAPMQAMVELWAEHRAATPAPATTTPPPRIAALLALIDSVTTSEHIAELHAAVQADEDAAVQLAGHLNDAGRRLVPSLLERGAQSYQAGDFRTAAQEQIITAELAAAVGADDAAARAFTVAAGAFRSLDNSGMAAEAYLHAIAAGERAATQPEVRALLAICHDNLGLLFAEAEQYDEAMAHFNRSLQLETSPEGRLAITNNKADAMASMGYYADACVLHELNHEALVAAGTRGIALARTLDNWASALVLAGDADAAVALLDQAELEFPPEDLHARWVNASIRASTHVLREDFSAAGLAFVECHDIALQLGKQQFERAWFSQGYQAALATRLPLESEAWQLLTAGVTAKENVQWSDAVESLQQAADAARAGGDLLLALRVQANIAAVLADAQRIDEAVELCFAVRDEAGQLGLATPMVMALGTLAGLSQSGADVPGGSDALLLAAQAFALHELQGELLEEAGLDSRDPERVLVADVGQVFLVLAEEASTHHADDLATGYYRRGIASARATGNKHGELNRMVGLLTVLLRSADATEEATELAVDLTIKVDDPALAPLTVLDIHRALAAHAHDPATATGHFQVAATTLEELRARMQPGAGRAQLDREYQVYPQLIASLQRSGAEPGAIFEVVQAQRGRRLMEVLTAATGQPTPYQPPTVAEAQQLLANLGVPTTLVEVTVADDGLIAYLLDDTGVRAVPVPGDLTDLRHALWGDARERAEDTVRLVAQSPLLADLATAVTAACAPGDTVLLVVDDVLSNLPLYAAPVGDRPWCEVASIGRLSAAGLLRFTPGGRTRTARSLVAGDSRGDLPGARAEAELVATALGGVALTGAACTLDAVRGQLNGTELDVIHLAVHGRGDVRRGGRASLLFADANGDTNWVPFEELASVPWRADLIVFSGCSTAVGGPRNGFGLYGVAQAAAEAGATSVIASLWPVDDESTQIVMTEFYAELGRRRATGGPVDLRGVLDVARAALRTSLASAGPSTGQRRDGREAEAAEPDADAAVEDMLKWAPFVVLGEPMLPA